MMTYDYDVVYIGSGHAAFHGASKLINNGCKVAIVEADKLGGTCPNYGCDAKLLLDGPFEVIEDAANYQGFGLKNQPEVNWEELMTYKQQFINIGLPQAMEKALPGIGIDVYHGQGSLIDAHTVQAGTEKISANYIVLATGQHDAKLSIPGKEYIHDSKDFLDLAHLPQKMVMIGAGLISLEFASMMVRAGVSVEVVEYADHALNGFYDKYVTKSVEKLKNEGVVFHFNEVVSKVTEQDADYTVSTESGLEIIGDYVFGAVGRQANVDGLNLEKLGIVSSERGIVVNDHLQTTLANIFVSGDAIDKRIPKLTPTAAFESNYIASQILKEDNQAIKYPSIPVIAFTLPRIAEVGLSIVEAQKKPDKYQIKVIPYGQSFDTKHDVSAELTLIFNKENNQVVGAAVYGGDAPHLINLLTFVIEKELTATDLGQLIFGFPDVSYSILSSINPNGFLG